MVRVAAVQLEPVIADVAANLRAADRLVRQAVREGAEWVLLPEFFTTGMGFVPSWPRAPFHPTGPPPNS